MEKVEAKKAQVEAKKAQVEANTNVKSPLTPVSEAQKAKEAQKNEHAANKDAEFKAKKAAAAKAFAERQAALKVDRAEAIKELKALADAKKINLDTMPKTKAWIEKETAVRTGNGGVSFFNKVFGDSPKVGDKITLLDYMKKTLKAKADLDKAVKSWAEKGIVVEFKDAANKLEATYTIVKLA